MYIDESNNTMELIVPDDQLAKAIGRRGQNVRLAAQLTGWRIDIHSETKHIEMMEQARNEIGRIATIDEGQLEILISSGFQSANEVADADLAEVQEFSEIDDAAAQSVIDGADAVVEALVMEEAERRNTVEDLPEEVDVPQEPTDDLPERSGR